MRLRRCLPWAAVAYALGIICGDAFPQLGFIAFCGALLLLAVALLLWTERALRIRVSLLLAALLLLGVRAMSQQVATDALTTASEAVIEARVTTVSTASSGWRAELRDIRVLSGHAPGALQVWTAQRWGTAAEAAPAAAAATLPAPVVGTRIRTRLSLRPFAGLRNPGGEDIARRMRRRGLGAAATLNAKTPWVVVGEAGFAPTRLIAAFRQQSARRLIELGPGGGLLAALALGERGGLPQADRDAASRGGVAHLLAVSGLHLALVAGAVFALAWRVLRGRPAARDPRVLALWVAAAVAVVYALLTGWQAPVQRALLFLLLLFGGVLGSRVVSPAPQLALAALGVLAWDPSALFEAGPQLSFAAVAALRLQRAAPDGGGGEGLLFAGRALLRNSAAATVATAPLLAIHLGIATPLGWFANVLAIPLVGLLLLPLALLSVLLVNLDAAPGSLALLKLAALFAEWVLAGLRAWSAFVPAPSAVAPGLVALGVSLLLAFVTLRLARTVPRLVAAVATVAAIALLPAAKILPERPRVVFLDVGWGDAVLVQGRSANLLIDAGGGALHGGRDAGARVVLPALAALGVKKLDLVVASHADRDHRGGLPTVLRALPVGEVWLPNGSAFEAGFDALRQQARARAVPLYERGAGAAPWQRGDLTVHALWPPPEPPPQQQQVAVREIRKVKKGVKDLNARSLVVAVELAGQRLLSTGDLGAEGEAALLARAAGIDATLLKLGHHGSRSSSSAAFLRAVRPRLAVVSAAARGRFDFPHPVVRARLRAQGIPWAWTGRDGAVLVGLAPFCLRTFAHSTAPAITVPSSLVCASR